MNPALNALAVYGFLLLVFRVAGRWTLGQITIFDWSSSVGTARSLTRRGCWRARERGWVCCRWRPATPSRAAWGCHWTSPGLLAWLVVGARVLLGHRALRLDLT